MNIRIRYTLLALLVQTSIGLQAQRFAYLDEMPTATFGSQVYHNVFLHSTPRTTTVNMPANTDMYRETHAQGSVFSRDLFTRKYDNKKTNVYRGFAAISAYQNITAEQVGGHGTPSMRLMPPPPPPTPNPDDPHILPIGDAWWMMILMALGYGAYKLRRRKQF